MNSCHCMMFCKFGISLALWFGTSLALVWHYNVWQLAAGVPRRADTRTQVRRHVQRAQHNLILASWSAVDEAS